MTDQPNTEQSSDFKVKEVLSDSGTSGFKKYKAIYHGDVSVGRVILCELVVTLFGWIPGALGLALRSVLYRFMFAEIGRKVIFGKDITLRHPHKIRIGDNVVIDDNCVLDAKGEANAGIAIGSNVYVGRNTIIYTKNGDITLEENVNISSNCQVFSCNSLTIGRDTVIGAFSYFLSGGEYDPNDPTPFAKQSGTNTQGPLTIGPNCWIAARVTVLDAASVGEHCVLGAGAVVNKPIPAHSIAVGVPARVLKSLKPSA
jgi:acetyltransferase-like isoleucine patch superfamily enzyme